MALKPEDGAKAQGHIVQVGQNEFRATFCVIQDSLSHIDMEKLDDEMFKTKEEARTWIHQQAARRGFKKIALEITLK